MNPQIKLFALGAGAYIAFVIIAAYLGDGVNKLAVVLVAGQLLLFGAHIGVNERLEDTRADTDQNGRDIDDVKAHLTGNDTPSSGRHAHSDAKPYYKPSPTPYPRSVA